MNFSNVDIKEILKFAMPQKFQDFTPTDFENFITQLFTDNGYKATRTPASGDFGADVIIEKDNEKTAVQIKRYADPNKVGVQDVNQALGSKDYYNCNKAIIITTSSYTNPAIELAKKAQAELWDWNRLQKLISNTYLDGKNHFEYFGSSPQQDGGLEFKVKRVKYNQHMTSGGYYTVIHATITNHSKNRDVLLSSLPIYITKTNEQFQAEYWYEGYYNNGIIYAGCSVDLCFMFKIEQLRTLHSGDKIIFEWLDRDKENPIVNTVQYTIDTENISGAQRDVASTQVTPMRRESNTDWCFIATAAYGSPFQSEVVVFRSFKQRILSKSRLGRLFIQIYYLYSPNIAKPIHRRKDLSYIARCILTPMAKVIQSLLKMKKRHESCRGTSRTTCQERNLYKHIELFT